jgi:hypothetical protein
MRPVQPFPAGQLIMDLATLFPHLTLTIILKWAKLRQRFWWIIQEPHIVYRTLLEEVDTTRIPSAVTPGFCLTFNLIPVTPCDNGQAISGYTTDINAATRAATPDIGAYEYQATANDAGVTAIVGPTAPFNAGTQNVVLTLSNFGNTALTSTNISYSVNGAAPVTKAWTGTLAQCATTNVTFSGGDAFNFAPSTTYTIKGFTSSPNGSSDGNTLNDTTTLAGVGTAMSGNYTIDAGSAASATNFQSFTAAASALSSGGVNGSVNITVMGSTPYSEQVSFSVIPGASAVNTITIDGGSGNAANRILSFNFPTTPTNFAVMRLNGADYLRIKNLTIRSTSTNWGYGVVIYQPGRLQHN